MAHASRSNVTEKFLVQIMDATYNHKNPVIRLSAADALLHLTKEMREVRQGAVLELHDQGRSWPEIGKVLGVSRQRAWGIGNGR